MATTSLFAAQSAPLPPRRPPHPPAAGRPRSTWGPLLVLTLCVAGAASLVWFQLLRNRLAAAEQHGAMAAAAARDAGSSSRDRVDDRLLQQVIQHCMQQQDTFIALTAARGVAVWPAAQEVGSSASSKRRRSARRQQPGSTPPPVAGCPGLHIPLASGDRSIGLCTDAALYVALLGAWVAPGDGPAGLAAAQRCGAGSAVLFLEPLYEPWLDWLAVERGVVAGYAPNFEHVFGYDRAAHARMQLVLCKVRRCEELMRRYLQDLGSSATLIYTGHTSLDPQAVQQPRSSSGAPPPVLAAGVQPIAALHVRGKSGLKHTKQLLDCWILHPEWPTLTVLGPMPNEQVSTSEARVFMAAGNIRVPQPGTPQGPDWPAFDPVGARDLAALMLSHALHIMPSEREGFGHSINEARAAGAVALVPEHPPMSELVRAGSGVLLRTRATFSHTDPPVPVLGRYANISVSMDAQDICAGVSRALALSREELLSMGRHARGLFVADRADFEGRMADVRALLQSLTQHRGAAAAA